MADKIEIDNNDYDEEYEPSDSDDDYNEEEQEILKEVRRGRKRDDKNAQKEVLAFSDSSDADDDDDDEDELIADSDIEGAEGGDDADIPDAKDWGSRSRNYYHTDFVDQDYSTYNEQEEEMAKQEEEEAKVIQLRLAKQMNEEDFLLDELNIPTPLEVSEVDPKGPLKLSDSTRVKKDFSGLSKRQKQQLFQKDSPEFAGLVSDFTEYWSDLETLLSPVLKYVRQHNIPLIPALEFAKLYENLVLTYCSNISFYLLLKAKRTPIKNHPITKRLVQLKKLLGELQDKYENIIKPQLEALLERIVDGDKFEVLEAKDIPKKDKSKKSKKLTVLEQYSRFEKSDTETEKEELFNEEDEGEEEEIEGLEEDVDGGERRAINYQIAKNKGLMPHRKKEQRNPRVKHRNKFRKALIRRKGAVRTVRKETQRYAGEMFGIKAGVTKSIKFKV